MSWLLPLALLLAPSARGAGFDRSARRLQDGESLPRYLERDEIVAGIGAAQGPLAACLADGAPDRSLRFELLIDSDGVVRQAQVEGDIAEGKERTCISSALSTPAFAPHDDDPIEVTGSVAVAGGVVLPIFAVTVRERPVDVLFLYLPPDLDGGLHRAIAAELGFRQPAEPTGQPGN